MTIAKRLALPTTNIGHEGKNAAPAKALAPNVAGKKRVKNFARHAPSAATRNRSAAIGSATFAAAKAAATTAPPPSKNPAAVATQPRQ
jgi:hypothetical protein